MDFEYNIIRRKGLPQFNRGVPMAEVKNEQSLCRHIAEIAARSGGRAYFVGGIVRDRLMGRESKDYDIEVHGIGCAELEKILSEIAPVMKIGASFGIYRLAGHDIDIAMPRYEKAVGNRHRDFEIAVDPFAGTFNAAKRRDFTINAIMEDILDGEITDHFGGIKDLEKGIIRHISDDSFGEDPLRVLRAAGFAARFGFSIADETMDICRKMDISSLSRERVKEELEKVMLKADKPSVFFENLRRMNQLGYWFSEIEDIIGVEQNPVYHAEGDVWTHTMMVVDAAADYRHIAENRFGFMLSALLHDLGKAVCTTVSDGRIRSLGHDVAGVEISRKFLKRLTNEEKLINYALSLAENHMKPSRAARDRSSVKATNHMFDRVDDPKALIYLALADGRGKIPCINTESTEGFLLERLGIYEEYMSRPYVGGKDLVDAGLEPGSDFGLILKQAHKLRLAGVEKDTALKQTLAYANELRKNA